MKTVTCILLLIITSLYSKANISDSSSQFFEKGLEEKKAGRHKLAFDYFQKAITINPNHIDAHFEYGTEALEIRQLEIARRAFLKVAESRPNDVATLEHLAQIHFSTRKWDDAIKYGIKLLEMKTGTRINYLVGRSYYEKENYGQAFRYLDAAYKEEPARAEIPYLFARAFDDMSNYKQSVKYFLEAISLDSSKAQWMYELALSYASIPDDKSAIIWYEKAMKNGIKTDNIFMENLSNSYIAAGMPEKGIEILKQMLDLRPADIELLYGVADTYYKMGKFNEAIEHWDKVLAYDKDNIKSLYMIGMAHQKKGETKKGQAICDKAIELDPSLKRLRQEKKGM